MCLHFLFWIDLYIFSSLSCPACGWDYSGTHLSAAAEGPGEFDAGCAGVGPRAHLLHALRWGALCRWTLGTWHHCREENGTSNSIFLIIQAQKGVSREECLSLNPSYTCCYNSLSTSVFHMWATQTQKPLTRLLLVWCHSASSSLSSQHKTFFSA